MVPLVAFPPPQERPVVEHVLTCRVQCPVVSFPRVTGLPWNFDEAVIEGKVVPYAVLPHGEFLPVVWETVHNKLADTA